MDNNFLQIYISGIFLAIIADLYLTYLAQKETKSTRSKNFENIGLYFDIINLSYCESKQYLVVSIIVKTILTLVLSLGSYIYFIIVGLLIVKLRFYINNFKNDDDLNYKINTNIYSKKDFLELIKGNERKIGLNYFKHNATFEKIAQEHKYNELLKKLSEDKEDITNEIAEEKTVENPSIKSYFTMKNIKQFGSVLFLIILFGYGAYSSNQEEKDNAYLDSYLDNIDGENYQEIDISQIKTDDIKNEALFINSYFKLVNNFVNKTDEFDKKLVVTKEKLTSKESINDTLKIVGEYKTFIDSYQGEIINFQENTFYEIFGVKSNNFIKVSKDSRDTIQKLNQNLNELYDFKKYSQNKYFELYNFYLNNFDKISFNNETNIVIVDKTIEEEYNNLFKQ